MSASSRTRLRRARPVLEELEDRTVPATLAQPGFQEVVFAAGLNTPTSMEFAPDGRLFVTEKSGAVRVIQNGALVPTPFLTVAVNSFSERGLNGLTFDPNFAVNRFVYIYYTTDEAIPVNRLSRFTASPTNPNVAQAGSEMVLLDDISATNGNHNGGGIHFGIDGKLYVAIGEAGVPNNSQSLSTLSGKVLRLDVSNPAAGIIPPDNPFVGTTGARGEIWALGFRNPFTFAVDPATGTIFVNDVGGAAFEEINNLVRGVNYGWPFVEGVGNNPAFGNPIHAYPHLNGAAITGGTFYRAGQFPPLFQGSYFFADFVQGFIRRLDPVTLQPLSFATNVPGPVDLDVGPDGRLYYLSLFTGSVFQITSLHALLGGGNVTVASVAGGGPPHVKVFDAVTRVERLSFYAYDVGFTGGVRVAAADVTGDSIPDVVTAPGPGLPGATVKVFDGQTGIEVRSFPAFPGFAGGVWVAAGNVNGDQFADVVAGADAGAGPHVKVFDGRTNALLFSFFAFDPGVRAGARVAVGDVDGDQRGDVIVSLGPGAPPHVKAFSGRDLSLLSSFYAHIPNLLAGVTVAAGDLDGDGRAEIITGIDGVAPHVKAFDGPSATLRASFYAYAPSFAGGARVGATDVDGDGRAEIVTGVGPSAGPHVKSFRPISVQEVDSFFAFGPLFGGGIFVAGA